MIKLFLNVLITFTGLSAMAGSIQGGQVFEDSPCFLEGSVYLTLNSTDPGTNPPTTITGDIGGNSVFWPVEGSLVDANIAGQMFLLNYSNSGAEFMISGFIRSTYVSWSGTGNMISTYQSCIE